MKAETVEKLKKPATETLASKPRHDSVRVGDPCIVYWEPGDSGGIPAPAIVFGVGGRRTLALMVCTGHTFMRVTGARHKDDPEFIENPELHNHVGTWAFNDEIPDNKAQ